MISFIAPYISIIKTSPTGIQVTETDASKHLPLIDRSSFHFKLIYQSDHLQRIRSATLLVLGLRPESVLKLVSASSRRRYPQAPCLRKSALKDIASVTTVDVSRHPLVGCSRKLPMRSREYGMPVEARDRWRQIPIIFRGRTPNECTAQKQRHNQCLY